MFLVVTGKIVIDWRERSCGHELRDHVVAEHRHIRKSACRERAHQPLLLIRPRDDLHINLDFGVNLFELGDGIFPGSDIGVAGRKLPKDDMRFSDCAICAGGDGESDASNNLRKPGSKIAGEMKLHKHMSSMTQAMR